MSGYIKRTAIVLIVLIAAALVLNIAARDIIGDRNTERNVVVQRITREISQTIEGTEVTEESLRDAVDTVFYRRVTEWEQLYGCDSAPEDVDIIMTGEADGSDADIIGGNDTLICGIYDGDRLVALAVHRFGRSVYERIVTVMNAALIVCAAVVLVYSLWVYRRILLPFERLSDRPERMARGDLEEKLPERRDRYLGKFVWGMNMLADKLGHDRQTILKISLDRERTMTALAHGIKTPVANIKLMCEAISTGLYSKDGSINEEDAKLAARIDKNADDIHAIVLQLLDTSGSVIYDFDPHTSPFYRKEIARRITEEYGRRLEIARIPFEIKSKGDVMINSDIDGILRILRQLMDNAVKYGDGTGIVLDLDKTDEGHFISVRNKGTPLPESELPFVWGSYWRGSNSEGIEGSGVGLYEARCIARALGGDIRMRTYDDMTETELMLPL
ncbi:MAG: HAMP domain-containing histidine kinase [Oscillospiraceae bacterium]|nr:HAMP domain-containing histidine kinase [Oscillospiraceae bacterium]